MRGEKIGILGGTFNPIHLGHLLIAQDALEQAGLDRVLFIPSAMPPHKRSDNLADAARRLAMVRRAIRGHERFAVSDIEIKRGGRSYSVDTLTELKRRAPHAEFYFIIGSDSLHELPTWKEIGRLRKLCRFIVVARPGFATTGRGVRVVVGHACDIASREIRKRIANGESIRYLVPDAVRDYIQKQKLYR